MSDGRKQSMMVPGNWLLAVATIYRVRHNAHCLTLRAASYRLSKQPPALMEYLPHVRLL